MDRDSLEAVRQQVQAATHRLLGDTISITDEGWRAPSLLPGWSRGHVATHLARNADALARVIGGAVRGEPVPMYPDDTARDTEIEQGAGRNGLDLQIDLDTSAERLGAAFDSVEAGHWDAEVTLRDGATKPVRALPLARLAEVVLHHLDLDCGFVADDLAVDTAVLVMDGTVARIGGREGAPSLTLNAAEGGHWQLGSGDRELSGSTAALLSWLAGRNPDAAGVDGADGLAPPSFG